MTGQRVGILDLSPGGMRYLAPLRCDCCRETLMKLPIGARVPRFVGVRLRETREQYCPECWNAFRDGSALPEAMGIADNVRIPPDARRRARAFLAEIRRRFG